MGKMNVEPMVTFHDGSQLLVSTQYAGEGRFACELYHSLIGTDKGTLRVVSDHLEASTCSQAQNIAYGYATRLYPQMAGGIKTPPYLIWSGPNLPVGPEIRRSRSMPQ